MLKKCSDILPLSIKLALFLQTLPLIRNLRKFKVLPSLYHYGKIS